MSWNFLISLSASVGVVSNDDSSFYIPTSTNGDDGSILEELCETLILTIVMVLWKGVVGADDDAWMLRGQIFSALRYLQRDHEFYLPLNHIEQRILELSMETCLNELKLNGGTSFFYPLDPSQPPLFSLSRIRPSLSTADE